MSGASLVSSVSEQLKRGVGRAAGASGSLERFGRRMMRSIFIAVALAWAGVSMASAQTSRPPRELLDRITGRWVLEGTIAGKTTTHDVVASWVLNGQYVQLHEISRERDAQGRPAYEAFVYLTWEPSRGEYSCLWLDSTSNAGLSNGVLGRAQPSGDELRLVFKYKDGSTFHTTFAYDRKANNWQWKMDAEEKGQLVPFARVMLRHK